VEDDEDTRFLYAEALVHLGFRTAGERDAERGIEAAIRLRPDAILMDVAMPGVGGIEATRRLKADPRTRDCLVVVVTGGGLTKFDEARAAGCDAFFSKPFDPSAVAHVLRAFRAPDETSGALPEGVVKRCSCGREYTHSQWLALPRCGRMRLPRRNAIVELRNCRCGSSMGLDLAGSGEASAQLEDEPDTARRAAALETVFVVERDLHVRRLVLHFIGSAYVVEFFDDGYSALDRARESPPSAVVAELMIPRLDGLALCRLLKGDPATADVPVLLFSVLAASDRAREAGADAFLEKPLEKERFVACLLGITEAKSRRGVSASPSQGAA
jgi:CheY-like chemotaxis protein